MPNHSVDDVLAFWFPTDHGDDLEAWKTQVRTWFRGGMDDAVIARFGPLLEAGERGDLDGWANTPDGRLALILVLDQFPRSIHAGSPGAYANDPRALALCLEGLDNGHYEALHSPWQKVFFCLPLGHAEGPDHLERLDVSIRLSDALFDAASPSLKPLWDFNRNQPRRHRQVIERFGRHVHRNPVLGRTSTPEEQAYLDAGEFPHSSAPTGSVFSSDAEPS